MNKLEYVAPIKGAAEYIAGKDFENKKKPCVFMIDTEGFTSIVEYAKTEQAAIQKARKWQLKENKAVEQNNPK